MFQGLYRYSIHTSSSTSAAAAPRTFGVYIPLRFRLMVVAAPQNEDFVEDGDGCWERVEHRDKEGPYLGHESATEAKLEQQQQSP